MSGECGDASIAQDLSIQSCARVGDYRVSVEDGAVTILNLSSTDNNANCISYGTDIILTD